MSICGRFCWEKWAKIDLLDSFLKIAHNNDRMPIKISFLECGVAPDYNHLIFKRIEPEWPFLHYVILRLFEGAGLVAGHRLRQHHRPRKAFPSPLFNQHVAHTQYFHI